MSELIQVALVIVPVLDRKTLYRGALSVTGNNHLQATDRKNLSSVLAEDLSILQDFSGWSEGGEDIVQLGFMFIGASNLVNVIPELVGAKSLTTALALSPMISANIVLASFRQWCTLVEKVVKTPAFARNDHLKRALMLVGAELNKLKYNNSNLLRLN